MDTGGVPYLQELPQMERFTPVTRVMDSIESRHVLSLSDTYHTAREMILGQIAINSNQSWAIEAHNTEGT